jgi:putative colanic acid biosynthesis acetyltransferase WcaF
MLTDSVRLDRFEASDRPGRSLITRALWYVVNALIFDSWFCPFYGPKRILLRCFGASIGRGVVIKPRVNIKRPWRLSVGDHSWIGEGVWIDNLASTTIGAHCCISQGTYLCGGNHDWYDVRFALRLAPISIADQCWIGAKSIVAPGVLIGEGTVTLLGSVVTEDTATWAIWGGNPAVRLRDRRVEHGRPQPTTAAEAIPVVVTDKS